MCVESYYNTALLFSEHAKYNNDTKDISLNISINISARKTNIPLKSEHDFRESRGEYIINKDSFTCSYFHTFKEFKEEVKLNDLNRDLIINNYKDGVLIYINKNDTIFYNGQITSNYLISNSRTFFKSKDLFKKLTNNSEYEFEFIDFYSESSGKIILSSISEKKRICLNIPKAGIINIDEDIDITKQYEEFEKSLSIKSFPIFLKRTIVSKLFNYDGNSYEGFFLELPNILKESNLNFQVYLHELSLDDIIKEYQNYKVNYFKEQTEILSKISNQVIALPITIASTLFAIYKLKDNTGGVLIIGISLLIFLIYLSHIISLVHEDLITIRDNTTNEFNRLRKHSFFIKHTDEFNELDKTRIWLIRRVNRIIIGLRIYSIFKWVIYSIVMIYSLNFIVTDFSNLNILISALIFLVIIVISNVVIFNTRNKNTTS